jgi:hypothetical protein
MIAYALIGMAGRVPSLPIVKLVECDLSGSTSFHPKPLAFLPPRILPFHFSIIHNPIHLDELETTSNYSLVD